MDKMKIRLCVFTLPVTSTFSCLNCKESGGGGGLIIIKKNLLQILRREGEEERKGPEPHCKLYTVPRTHGFRGLNPTVLKFEELKCGTNTKVSGCLSIVTMYVSHPCGTAPYGEFGFCAAAAYRR